MSFAKMDVGRYCFEDEFTKYSLELKKYNVREPLHLSEDISFHKKVVYNYREDGQMGETDVLVDLCQYLCKEVFGKDFRLWEYFNKKYKWHDKVKDSAELPNDKANILCIDEDGDYSIMEYHAPMELPHYVVAWKYIEPFETENEYTFEDGM